MYFLQLWSEIVYSNLEKKGEISNNFYGMGNGRYIAELKVAKNLDSKLILMIFETRKFFQVKHSWR